MLGWRMIMCRVERILTANFYIDLCALSQWWLLVDMQSSNNMKTAHHKLVGA
jgi:hypothetical protein